MRPRIVVLLIAFALALTLGFVGRATEMEAFDLIAGIMWLMVIVIAISLLPFWRNVIPDVPALPGLFTAPGNGERWCAMCGSATAKGAACHVCGHAPSRRPSKSRT